MELILKFFGYTKVPKELAYLACQIRMMWEINAADPKIGAGLRTIERWARSANAAMLAEGKSSQGDAGNMGDM